jgi:hypothetical protein
MVYMVYIRTHKMHVKVNLQWEKVMKNLVEFGLRKDSPKEVQRGEHIAMFTGLHHLVETDADGNWHVYRKRTATSDERVSPGADGGTATRLREKHKQVLLTLADVNTANAKFWKR